MPSGHKQSIVKRAEPQLQTKVESKQMVKGAIFDLALEKLNPSQRQAVETIEGPVMVVAGPGTGKTQVLSMRVATILKKTQMRPSNILCLTFSTSGATAMRERLRSLIGPDAYGVKVSTIHGFCNEIITQYPQVFEEWSALEQISEVERYRAVNAIIDDLMPEVALVNRKHPHARTRDILARISQLKREGKDDLRKLEKIADAYEAELSGKSKEGTKAHERNLLQAKKFRELVTIFGKYQEMLTQTGRYDYDDMILHVIHALQEEEWLLATLQERYQYVLVDEFQDTNGAQYRFIELVTTYANLDHAPNLFVVGDDDQAIYRFQGANLQNLLNFHSRFPKAPVIALTVSYRSTQEILDAAGRLIANNTERLVGRIEGLEKNLESSIQNLVSKNHSEFQILNSKFTSREPKMIFAASSVAEPWLVADLLEERLAAGRSPDEIAVLTQTNAELRPLYDVFRARNIPVQIVGKVDLLTHPKVQQILAVLRAVENPESTAALAAALACEQFRCNAADLARLFVLRRERETPLSLLLLGIELLSADMTFHNLAAIVRARDCIFDLHQKIGSRTVVETVERVLRDCNFLDSNQPENQSTNQPVMDPLDLSALHAFYDHVRSRAQERPHYDYRALMADLTLYQNPEYGDLRLQYVMPHLAEQGVQLMTAHQSKGLEFETVILTNFREGHWDTRRNPPSLSVPEDLLYGWEKEQKSYEQNQDERRVAYVAMTRAKTELFFTTPQEVISGDRAREAAPSAFFAEAGPLPEEHGVLRDPSHASTLLLRPVRALSAELQAFLRERLQTFELSVTALNRFLRDPQEFLHMDLMRMPEPVQLDFAFGSAAHEALRKWGVGVQKGEPLTEEMFFTAFEHYIERKAIATDAEKRNLIREGQDILPRYYRQRLAASAPVIFKIEHPIRAHLESHTDAQTLSIPLFGKIDRIDLDMPDARGATVIDYKTGLPKTESQIREGDLYRQITFYALLCELGFSIVDPHTFQLEFLGNREEHPVSRAFHVSREDREDLKTLIRNVWGKIQALDFTPL